MRSSSKNSKFTSIGDSTQKLAASPMCYILAVAMFNSSWKICRTSEQCWLRISKSTFQAKVEKFPKISSELGIALLTTTLIKGIHASNQP